MVTSNSYCSISSGFKCDCPERMALTQPPVAAAAGARRARELYESLPARSPYELVELAGCHAIVAGQAGTEGSGVSAADGRAAADAAVAALRQAVAGGYGNLDALRRDASLDALRGRADFQKLLTDLESRPEAKDP
jgi:hypothetical protein